MFLNDTVVVSYLIFYTILLFIYQHADYRNITKLQLITTAIFFLFNNNSNNFIISIILYKEINYQIIRHTNIVEFLYHDASH